MTNVFDMKRAESGDDNLCDICPIKKSWDKIIDKPDNWIFIGNKLINLDEVRAVKMDPGHKNLTFYFPGKDEYELVEPSSRAESDWAKKYLWKHFQPASSNDIFSE